MRLILFLAGLLTIVASPIGLTGRAAGAPASSGAIYTDSLQNGWQPWGWAKVIDYNNTKPVHSGKKSIAIKITKGFDALYLHHAAFSTKGFRSFSFWANGGATGGQFLQIQATENKKPVTLMPPFAGPLPAHAWTHIVVPLSDLNIGNKPVDGFWIQDHSGHPEPVFYVDDISLTK